MRWFEELAGIIAVTHVHYPLFVENAPLRDMLSSIILKLNEEQVLLELHNKWWKVNDNACKHKKSAGGNKQLRLENLGKIVSVAPHGKEKG